MSAQPTPSRVIFDWLSTCPSDVRCRSQSYPASTSTSRQRCSGSSYSTASDMSTTRSSSPSKRRRTGDNEILPHQSASITSPTELTNRTKLHASVSSRPPSPVRDLQNELRVAEPSIECTPPKGINLPEHASLLRKELVLGFGQNVIPAGLKDRLYQSDPDGTEAIPDYAFDYTTTYTAEELELLWLDVSWISKEADWNTMYGADENSWCDVVRRIVQRGLRASGSDRLDLKSVQSQNIESSLLSCRNGYPISRKTDFTLAFSCHSAQAFSLYQEISLDGMGVPVSHTTDPYTKRIALFSGLEVKRPGGNIEEAEAQLSIWLAASLEKVKRLALPSLQERYHLNRVLPTVGWTAVGHDWHTYIAYKVLENGREKTRVLGPIDMVAANSRSYYGIFKVVDLVKRVALYGDKVYWPWLRDDVLKPMIPIPACNYESCAQ